MSRCALALVGITLMALSLAGCLTAQPLAWEHFDACANEPTFHAMVTCGKRNRQTMCEANRNCSPDGNAIVAYAESLDQSVQRRQMSEPEARRRWIEFRMARSNEERQAEQAAAAAAAASGPVFCTPIGNSTICH
jgi:hypothetical protein